MRSQKWIAYVMFLLIAACVFSITYLHADSFSNDYWVDFLTSILTNLIVVGIALFGFDRILAGGRESQLRQLNQARAEFVVFELNRFLFKLLVELELINKSEYFKGDVNNLERDIFADVPEILHTQITSGAFAQNFKNMMQEDPKKILNFLIRLIDETFDRLTEKLGEIYPQPKPEAMELVRGIRGSTGFYTAQKPFVAPTKTTFKRMSKKGERDIRKMLKDHAAVFKLVSFAVTEPQLKKLITDVLILRRMALENKLHLPLL